LGGFLAAPPYGSFASGVSPGGSIIVGSAWIPAGRDGFALTNICGMTGLGDLPGGAVRTYAEEVSDDGRVIVGQANFNPEPLEGEAFRWTLAGGMQSLGDLPGGTFYSWASGVSADGEVICGFGHSAGGYEAFRWTQSDGMVGLGDLTPTFVGSLGRSISADGKVIVGSATNALGQGEAFRWTLAGGMQGLGDLPGGPAESEAFDASRDGSVIVGVANLDAKINGGEAFIWDAAHGMRGIKQLLQDQYGLDLTGWTLIVAWALSDDGRVIAGEGFNPNGDREGWIARLPESCPSDVDGNSVTDVDDLLAIIAAWGACP
jgi:probable HAF family extracellular repeat protein